MVTLVSSDGARHSIHREALLRAELFRTVTQMADGGGTTEFAVGVDMGGQENLRTLAALLDAYHRRPFAPLKRPLDTRHDVRLAAGAEVAALVGSLSHESLFAALTAADYLGHQPLVDLLCGHIATLMMGGDLEEIRRTFNIVNDLSSVEEGMLQQENEWAMRLRFPELYRKE